MYWKDKVYTSELEQLSNNFFLLLSYVDLKEMQGTDEAEQVVNAVLKALTASNNSQRFWEVKYFLKFLECNIGLFNIAQIEWSLKVITEYHGHKYSFGYRLAHLFKKKGLISNWPMSRY